ncbi:MAG: M12 family metallopeptidase [Candidatus Cryptobacteroides sp.]
MKRKTIYLSLLLVSCLLASCSKSKDDGLSWTERWVVGSETVEGYEGVTCLWIKRDGNPVWEMSYGRVDGFEHETGYEYVVDVKATVIPNPPADASAWKYSLVRVISKEKKNSEVPILTTDLSKCPANTEAFLQKPSFDAIYGVNDSIHFDTSNFYQGDVLLTEDQSFAAATKAGCLSDRIKYWPNNTVYYTYSPGFTGESKVVQAINEWQSKTSLTFVNGTGYGNYIVFINDEGNYSCVGMIGGGQPISLSATESSYGTAIHEIGHAVGMIHEHCRNDRDSYITVHAENIYEGKQSNFDKYPTGEVTDVGTFDFGSVMMYSSSAFSSNDNATITTKDGLYIIGQRTHLSSGDVQGVAAMYGPPFHSLFSDINVITDEVNGLTEICETETTYTIRIFEDKDFTVPATLQFPRNVTLYRHRVYYDSIANKLREENSTTNVTIPAGTSSYVFGTVSSIEEYYMSNPVNYDVTNYSIAEYNNLVGSRVQ